MTSRENDLFDILILPLMSSCVTTQVSVFRKLANPCTGNV